MTPRILTFNEAGYDPFIDFLKAYSIVCVIIAHILPPRFNSLLLFEVWGNMQVPMFVLIQVFHAYKKGVKPTLQWARIFKRVCLPFIAVQAVVIVFKALMGGGGNFLIYGGYGPGSYYPWVYLQLAIILVLIYPCLKRLSIKQALLLFLAISIGFELLFSFINLPDWLYRLLCVRYLFLIPLGMVWIEKGVVLNWSTIVLSVLSILAVLFFVFTSYNLEPLFFNTGWETHRWICYFYLPFLLTSGLYLIWRNVKKWTWIVSATKWTAARSYEIFLAQMAIFASFEVSVLSFIHNNIMRFAVWAIFSFVFSLLLGGQIYWFRKTILKW